MRLLRKLSGDQGWHGEMCATEPVLDSQVYRHGSGSVECKVCLTLHPNITSYRAHSQGKRHLLSVATWSKAEIQTEAGPHTSSRTSPAGRGIPHYRIQKLRNPETGALGFLVELYADGSEKLSKPAYRIMSSYEQTAEKMASDHQYLVLSVEPFEIVAIKIPNLVIDEACLWDHFSETENVYYVHLMFKSCYAVSVEVREEYKHEISVSERALGSFVHQKKASIMTRTSVLADALKTIHNAEKAGKRQVLIRPASKVIIRFLRVIQKHGYIDDFEFVDDHRAGKIAVFLNGRLNKVGVISPRFNVKIDDIENWVTNLLPSRQFGYIILTTSAGIMDHEEARRKHVAGKILGFVY